jgi:hypothetical protein
MRNAKLGLHSGLLGLLLAIPAFAAAAPRRSEPLDLCLVTSGSPLNTFVFQDVTPLGPGRSIPLHGLYFSSARRVSPFSGSAVMASDGSVRVGVFVHSSATPSPAGTFLNDFTMSVITDTTLAGAWNVDYDGDFVPNIVLPLIAADCGSISIP